MNNGLAITLAGLFAGVLAAHEGPAQVPVTTPLATAAAAAVVPLGTPVDYTFASGAGLLFYYVTPALSADFELILGRIREALAKAESPQRKQQALNWKIYKSDEATTGATVYVFAFDPALTTASYDPLLLLAEVLPGEVQPLYERLKAAVIKTERMGLTKIR
ncbi:MAG: hypothetical protein HQ485_06265 [Acidobacteria bacterium]|nr:hypothetical protein [Acidobacteriota bacterium]